jgi:hypothetical protein
MTLSSDLFSTDLYPILVFYAQKNNSPHISVDYFLDFLGSAAKRYSVVYPAWSKWLQNREVKFWSEMSALIEEGKCEFVSEADHSQIFMPHYYPEMIKDAYQNADNEADIPFPSEESMGVMLPPSQVEHMGSESDFFSAMDSKGKSAKRIVKIIFPDDFASALVPSDMIPRQLAEIAILKVRNYLKRYGNNEYTFHKLAFPLQGKESFLKQQLEHIVMRPLDAYNDMKDGLELTYIFWAHFCALVKTDIKKKQEPLPMDVAAFQSFSIMEALNGYYRTLAIKRREIEQAFRNLENCLAKQPYLYSMSHIINFTDSKGKLLLGQYTAEELEAWLKKHSTEGKNNELPLLLALKSSATDDRCFILKDKVLTFCIRLLVEARTLINDAILKQWSRLLMEYKSEPPMGSDEQFEKELFKTGQKLCPDLMNLLADPKLLLVYRETEQSANGVPSSIMIFSNGVLLPYSSIFQIRRRDLLERAKSFLPFWYSMPALFALIGFFKKMFKKQNTAKSSFTEIGSVEQILEENSRVGEIRSAALELELKMTPAGHSLDSYLEQLEDRWSRIVDRRARDHLIKDVKFLAKDSLRRVLKVQKQFKPTKETIHDMAFNLVTLNKALSSLGARDSLILYVELYILKLMGNIK